MSDFDTAADGLSFAFRGVQQIDERFDYKTGRFDGDTDPTNGLPVGEIWVHRGDGRGDYVRAKNKLGVLSQGIPVSIAEHVNPTYTEITGYDYLTIQSIYPTSGGTLLNQQQSALIESWQFKPGLVGVESGLVLRVLPYWLNDKLYGFPLGTPITAIPTATSGKTAYILIGHDLSTNTLTQTLAADMDAPTYVTVEDALALSTGVVWFAAVKVANGATEINPSDFLNPDMRWFNINGGGSTSPLFAKGDIYTYDTADQRLAVGSNGQVLTADSAQATGNKWAFVDAADVTYTPTAPLTATNVQGALDEAAALLSAAGMNKDKFTQTGTQTVSNTTSETTLIGSGQGSPAFDMDAVGRVIEGELWGIISTLGVLPGTLNVKVKIGSTVIVSTGAVALTVGLTAVLWNLRYRIVVVTTGATGTVRAEGKFVVTNALADITEMMTNGTSTVTVDTTGTPTQGVTVTFGTASASNSITSTNADVRILDPNTGAGGSAIYSERATIFHVNSTALTGSAFTISANTAQIFCLEVYQSSHANTESFTNGFELKAGAYTMTVCGSTASNRGIIDWYLKDNGGSYYAIVTGQDWYSGGVVNNVYKTATVTIVADGYHVLKGVVNGSTGGDYYMPLTFIDFKPATD